MARGYSDDLRVRVIRAVDGGASARAAARRHRRPSRQLQGE